MIIHIGENISLFKEDIISIFDKKTLEKSNINKDILEKESINKLSYGEEVKSLILVHNRKNKKNEIYISSISSDSLLKRSNIDYVDWRKVNVK